MITFEQAVEFIRPYTIGGAVTTIGLFAGGFIQRFFKELDRRDKHKINVANEVHKVINEASTSSYFNRPRNIEHINAVLTDLKQVDNKMGEVMNKFVAKWQLLSPYKFYEKSSLSGQEK